MKKITGPLSAELNQHIEFLCNATVDAPYTVREIASILNQALVVSGHEVQITVSAIQNRFQDKPWSLEGRLAKAVRAELPMVVISTPLGKESLQNKEIWTPARQALVRAFVQNSRMYASPNELQDHRTALLQALNETGLVVTRTALDNQLADTDYGPWGMVDAERDQKDLHMVMKLLEKPQHFASKGDFYSSVGLRLQSPQQKPQEVRKRLMKLGIAIPAFGKKPVIVPNKIEERLRAFAVVWNDASYSVSHDIERALNMSWKKVWQERQTYRKYLSENAHVLSFLPLLSMRRRLTGEFISLPEEVLKELDIYRLDRSTLKGVKGVVVTGAQWGASLNHDFWQALKHYAKHHEYALVVMPMKYGKITSSKDNRFRSLFPREFEGHVIFDDVVFKDTLQLNVARLRPTLEKHLTDKLCQMGGNMSQVFAAPNVQLEHRPRIGHSYPKAIMTTGAVTHPNYKADPLGQQDRTGEVATAAHQYACTVIEFGKKRGEFHFRHLVANKKGEFYDVDVKHGGARYFTERGHTHRAEAVDTVVLGDWHHRTTCSTVRTVTFERKGMLKTLVPKHVVLHDMMDNTTANSYRKKQKSRSSYLASLGFDSVRDELHENIQEIEWMRKHFPATYHWVPSNHPDSWMGNWVGNGEWLDDYRNAEIGAELFLAGIKDLKRRGVKANPYTLTEVSPIALYMRERLPWLHVIGRQEPFMRPEKAKHPILLSLHGDIGPGGKESRGTMAFLKYNTRMILGHNHSATIYMSITRVGTSTKLIKHYVEGPATNWTNTHGLVFENGQVMLINIINGRWHG